MEVRWSEAAAEDLERICEWIDRDDPEAARRVARTIYEQCGRLRDFPPYIVVYQVKPNAVEISRIFHGAQDWP
jgi:toxin ParE1/3/4